MAGSRVSDFTVDRILSQLGPKPQVTRFSPNGQLRDPAGGLSVDRVYVGPPASTVWLQSGGFSFHHTDHPHPNTWCCYTQDSADPQKLSGYCGYYQAETQPRPRARMRTVFTHSQTNQLEKLFQLTDYPTPEARAEVARTAGLSEETVRVWFKNRRARRKRQHSGSKVTSPSLSPSAGPDQAEKLFTSFL
ncbi:dharma [Thalassophryne amazonica]|uniref:dharma n=1 Tax=Thalassophryne amazonica TaxID=390379 RepID=UPI001471DAB0|nr:dharma [Thalassophryne amazonica]